MAELRLRQGEYWMYIVVRTNLKASGVPVKLKPLSLQRKPNRFRNNTSLYAVFEALPRPT